VIGAINGAMAMAIAPFSGGLFNPARSMGPLFILDEISSNDQMYMCLVPFAGCTVAMWLYKKLLISEELDEELDEL